jgi:pre-mRNA-splicing factor ATP-dependent RNA helicase DHX38/PRP16
MKTSGVLQQGQVDLDFEDETGSRVHVLVHDIKPPFLDGRVSYTRQLDPISPIRDPTSDLAVFSKKGSALVREKREQAERAKVSLSIYDISGVDCLLICYSKAAAKVAGVTGTTLGNIMGVKDEPDLGAGGSLSDLDTHSGLLS